MSRRLVRVAPALLLLSIAVQASAQDVVMRRPLPSTSTTSQGCEATGTCGPVTPPPPPPTCTTTSNSTSCCITQSDGSSSCCVPDAGQTTCDPTPTTPVQPTSCAPGTESYDTSNASWVVGPWVDSGDGCNKTRDVYCGVPDDCLDGSGSPMTITKRLDDSVCASNGPSFPFPGLGPVS